jgi:hypothetical protein
MSHLSILPTVLCDAEGLTASLEHLGHHPIQGGELVGFAGERHSVAVQVTLPEGTSIGWARQSDGSLALVGDLQRLSRCRSLQLLLSQLTRGYAAHMALRAALSQFPGAELQLSV